MTLDSEYTVQYSLEYAAKLANLAALMRLHPGLNWSSWNPGEIHVDNADEMAEAVKRIGRGKWVKESSTWDFKCVLKAADNAHFDIVVAASHASVCEKVGEEAVEQTVEIDEATIEAVKAGETQVVKTRMKPVWKCPTSILAVTKEEVIEVQ